MFEATTLILQLTHLNVQRAYRSEPEMSGVNRSVTRCFLINYSATRGPSIFPVKSGSYEKFNNSF